MGVWVFAVTPCGVRTPGSREGTPPCLNKTMGDGRVLWQLAAVARHLEMHTHDTLHNFWITESTQVYITQLRCFCHRTETFRST